MKGVIKKEFLGSFNPTTQTVIGGKVVKITLKQAQTEAEKWVNTGFGVMYEDLEKLKEEAKKRVKKVISTKLDMNKVTRGNVFDPENNPKKQAIAAFREKQLKAIEKFAKRNQTNPHKVEVLDAKEIAKKNKAAEKQKTKG